LKTGFQKQVAQKLIYAQLRLYLNDMDLKIVV
jgi:hypothetical protein